MQEFADQQADSISELWENQKLVFKQFDRLADTSNKLVYLGVANAAVTRALIEQLKTKSSKPLSEDARRHLLNVIKDLERQADAQDRINRLRDTISSAISKETEERKTDIKKINVSIDKVKDCFLELLKEESSKRIAEFERFQSLMVVLESNLSNMNVTLNNTIQSSTESHSAKEELLHNEISKETEERKTDIKKINVSIDKVKDCFFKLLKEESSKRIAEFERFQSLTVALESNLSNMNATLNNTIQSSTESHSAKEELLHNEITQLQSKNKVSMWIGIIASLVAIISLILNFIL